MGFKGMPISYPHFYFHNGCVLLTHAYATNMTATTVGDGGNRAFPVLEIVAGHHAMGPLRKDPLTIGSHVGVSSLTKDG
jgi:hypothetical protein